MLTCCFNLTCHSVPLLLPSWLGVVHAIFHATYVGPICFGGVLRLKTGAALLRLNISHRGGTPRPTIMEPGVTFFKPPCFVRQLYKVRRMPNGHATRNFLSFLSGDGIIAHTRVFLSALFSLQQWLMFDFPPRSVVGVGCAMKKKKRAPQTLVWGHKCSTSVLNRNRRPRLASPTPAAVGVR